jgi:hypothetical protein
MNIYTCVIRQMRNDTPLGARTIYVECDLPAEIAAAVAGYLSEPGVDDPAFTSVELIAAFEGQQQPLDASETNQCALVYGRPSVEPFRINRMSGF